LATPAFSDIAISPFEPGIATARMRVKAIYRPTTSGEMFELNVNVRFRGSIRVDAAAFTTIRTIFTANPAPLTVR
jgi:hypothetical protein